MGAAERLLETADAVELSLAEANTMAGRELVPQGSKRPYLVRGVVLNRETGGFRIAVNGNDLLVYHGCLGGSPVPMKRQALIVMLPEKPRRIFVTCGMTQ
jgi:hypothetical protein